MNIDLAKPGYFFNRELSWLKFNLRVLKGGRSENHAFNGTLKICVYFSLRI